MALLPMPLYAGLSLDVQQRVFAKAAMQTRKVVISTNIAEASVTIDGRRRLCGDSCLKTSYISVDRSPSFRSRVRGGLRSGQNQGV